MAASAIGTDRAVEVLHERGLGMGWTSGSGYLIRSRLVLTAAHNVDYRRDLGDDEKLLVRTITGGELAARVVLVCDELSRVDLALLKISDPLFGEHLPPVTFARVNRDSPMPVADCWAVGFPRFGAAGPVLPGGSDKETWHIRGEILPGGKRRAGLLSLQVTIAPQIRSIGSAWEGMSGAVVFAADVNDGEPAAVGVISTHHLPEGESALTVVPITAIADLAAAAEWWEQLGVTNLSALPALPRRRAQAGSVLATAAPGWPLAEVTDPFALEVHRPIQPEGPQPGLRALPTYVPREHDAELGSVVRAAAQGHSGIAVLVGGSSTGKTRACWEALSVLRDRPEQWRLWHPIDPTHPDAALRDLPVIMPRTVVWLNGAQLYLDVANGGQGERVAAGLRELLRDPARAPVLVLATLWPQYWAGLTARLESGPDPHAQARELLAGRDITVPPAFTATQLRQLSETGDVRLAQAAAGARDGQVTQFLAGAPELLARYRNAPPAAAALVNVAMDARRLGMGIDLPEAFLEAAAPGYLTDDEWDALDDDWLESALAYMAVSIKGVRGPLTRIRPRPAPSRPAGPSAGDGNESLAGGQTSTQGRPLYRFADYLDQYGRQHRKGQFPPTGFWAAAAGHVLPRDQAVLGDAANDRGLFRIAAQLHKNAAAGGNLGAAFYLIHPHRYLRADVRPGLWAIAKVPLHDPAAVAELLGRLERERVQGQVTALLDRNPAARVSLDDPGAVVWLLDRLRQARAEGQVTALLDRNPAACVSVEDPAAVARLLDLLGQVGAREQVTKLANRAAADVSLDDPAAVAALLISLREAGARGQVTTLADRAAAHVSFDDPAAVAALLGRLGTAGAREQVSVLLNRDPAARVSLDDPGAVAWLLGSLRQVGAREQVSVLLDRDPAARVLLDDLYAVARLLGSLREAGAREQVTTLADRAAALVSLDDPAAVAALLDLLGRVGARGQVTTLADRAAALVSLDDPAAVAALLDRLRQVDALEQVTTLLDRDPAACVSLNNPYAVAALLDCLRWVDAREQATTLLDRDPAAQVSLDDPAAVATLLVRLREAGAQAQVTTLADRLPGEGMFQLYLKQDIREDRFQFGRETDGSPAEPWGWEDLD
jgi:hypothetical protein